MEEVLWLQEIMEAVASLNKHIKSTFIMSYLLDSVCVYVS